MAVEPRRLYTGYDVARVMVRGDTIEALSLPGFSAAVEEILGEEEDEAS